MNERISLRNTARGAKGQKICRLQNTGSPNARSAVPYHPQVRTIQSLHCSPGRHIAKLACSLATLPYHRNTEVDAETPVLHPPVRCDETNPTQTVFQLHSAAKGGSERVVAALLGAGSGPDVNQRTQAGNRECPLHIAAKLGYSGVVAGLVRAGADVNSRDRNGWAPLHLAARFGQIQVANHGNE